jgi:hypothetical protein
LGIFDGGFALAGGVRPLVRPEEPGQHRIDFLTRLRHDSLLSELIRELHRPTTIHVNELDLAPGRQVWFQYWDTRLTYKSSYLARLKYVHHNPVKHGLVPVANQYRWCSARWIEGTATSAKLKTISRQKIDRVQVEDDYEPI